MSSKSSKLEEEQVDTPQMEMLLLLKPVIYRKLDKLLEFKLRHKILAKNKQ